MPDPPVSAAADEPGKRPFSLRGRLLLIATLGLTAALGLVGLALNAANQRVAVSSLQARMESHVYLVLGAMDVGPAGGVVMEGELADPRLSQPGSGVYVRVQGSDDVWNSASSVGLEWPELPAAGPGEVVFTEPAGGSGYFILRYGVGWQLEDDRIVPFTVSVLVEATEIERQTSAFRLGLWRSLGTAAVMLVLAQVVIFYFGFRPLRRVARDVARVESGRAARLQGDYPAELEPLARNVNRLLDTEESNRQRIRNALDSLAHSLKTPLAVIQAGLAVQQQKSESGRQNAAIQNAVDDMQRLIATRLERAGGTTRRTLVEPVPVEPEIGRLLRSLQKVYSQKMIRASATIGDDLVFNGEKRDLLELTGNLADNAFKYGEGEVRISAGPVDPGATRPGLWIRVEDDGPGIAPEQRERLLQRGVRGDERVEGHGLGLAIVLELVSAYGGEVTIGQSDLGGATILVELPAS